MSIANEQGAASWFSLMTSDVSACNDFYAALLGWKLTEHDIPGMGKAMVYGAADKDFGGPVEMDSSHGVPNHWISYFAVGDVDAKCQQLPQLGGKVCYEPFDMPGFGRSAVVEDPDGNVFHLWTPKDADTDISVMGDTSGQPCWLELMVSDLDKAQAFYGGLLDWDFTQHDVADMPYIMCSNQQGMIGGMMVKPPEMDMLPPSWLTYFSVPSLEDSMEQASALGGTKLFGPVEVPETGQMALYQDPSNAVFYLFEPLPGS